MANILNIRKKQNKTKLKIKKKLGLRRLLFHKFKYKQKTRLLLNKP